MEEKATFADLLTMIKKGEIGFREAMVEGGPKLISRMAGHNYPSFKLIPEEFLTPELIDTGAMTMCQQWDEKDCYVKGDYEQSALNLINKGIHFSTFHHALITKAIIDACIESNPLNTVKKRKELGTKASEFFDAAVLNKAVGYEFELLMHLDGAELKLLTDETIVTSFRKSPSQGLILAKIGRKDILIQEIANGLWSFDDSVAREDGVKRFGISRPKNIGSAVNARMKIDLRNKDDTLYLNAYIAGYPLEEVIRFFHTPARREVLMEIFPTDQLIEAFKGDRQMMGRIVEADLGL